MISPFTQPDVKIAEAGLDISCKTWTDLVDTFKFLQYFLGHEKHLKKIKFIMEPLNPFGYFNCKETGKIHYILFKPTVINSNNNNRF